MKKKLIFGLSLGVLLTTATGLTIASLTSTPERPVYHPAMAVSDGYTMTINKIDGYSFEYSPFEEEFKKNNFNEDPISFRYKRASSYSNGLVTLSGAGDGGFIYNPWLNTSKNYNGLDGIDSITVNFNTKKGKLHLSYGMSSNEYLDTVELTSGIELSLEGINPSHIKIINTSGAGHENEVSIVSISVHYHSYTFYEEQSSEFETVISSVSLTSINVGSSITLTPAGDKGDIANNNYLRFNYKSSENLEGTINYVKKGSTTQYSEPIFLSKNDKVFSTFLDAFRNSAKGNFAKVITSITLKNVGHSTATFSLTNVGVSSRVYYRNDTYYVGDNMVRLGISMRYGGSIVSVQNVSTASGYNIQEYVTTDGEIKIRSADNNPDDINNVIKTHPNLANIYDLGREIQQSYYIGVDETNGYTRHKYNNAYVDYNPVQAGDQNRNESKIVDYEVKRGASENITSIYVKVMACDWADSNALTKSYMENTYTVDNGLIYVNNRFTDWSGFSNYPFDDGYIPSFISTATAQANGWGNRNTVKGYLGFQTAELPAVYIAHPLNYFSAMYDGQLVFDKNQGWDQGTTAIEHLSNANMQSAGTYNGWETYKSGLSSRSYHYTLRNHSEDWLGYFNEDKFGVGIYMPATSFNRDGNYRHIFSSGNLYESHNASDKKNRYYLDENYNTKTASYSKGLWGIGKKDLTLESALTDNTNYCTTILGFYPHEYVTLDWTYAIGADYLANLRTKFNNLKTNSTINNDFTVWSGAEI